MLPIRCFEINARRKAELPRFPILPRKGCEPASPAPPLNPTGAIGDRGTRGRVLSTACRAKHGRAEDAPLTGSGRPPDNRAPV
jgi:hypothetical protein